MKACGACGKDTASMQTFTVESVAYHRACFKCALCNAQLGSSGFLRAGEHSFSCANCFKCAKPIAAGDTHLVFGDAKFHNKCLHCCHDGCNRALTSKKLWKLASGMPACEAHNGL